MTTEPDSLLGACAPFQDLSARDRLRLGMMHRLSERARLAGNSWPVLKASDKQLDALLAAGYSESNLPPLPDA